MSIAPQIPENAPFDEAQRNWLDGYIAAFQKQLTPDTDVNKETILVIYASQSGNSEALAEEFGSRLASTGFNAPVICTEDYKPADLVNEKKLLIISSTWGEGDPPDNAVDFWAELSSDDQPKLEQLSYSVLGLGDSNYIDFCGMAKRFDSRLEALGAKRIAPRVDCDTDYEEISDEWFAAVASSIGAPAVESSSSSGDSPTGYSKKNPFPATLLTNQKLNAEAANRDTRHFEISLKDSGLSYEVGDVLGVYPKNDPSLVEELASIIGLQLSDDQKEALLSQFDICTISSKLIEKWLPFCKPETTPPPADYCDDHQLIDLAISYPATFSSFDELSGILRKLGPRLYSISSSPKAHPDEVHLTVAKVDYDLHDRPRQGVCSNYLSERVSDSDRVGVFLQKVKHFKLPTDTSIPVVMVGPGTGIAPFRAFIEERDATVSPGKNWLFFGNPHQSTDWLYKDQLQAYVEKGVLTNYTTAWSRDQEEKIYVQNHIIEHGKELWQWLTEGAHFYVCGDAKRMAKDVDDALHQIISTHGEMSAEQAADYVSTLKKDKRYQRDVY